MPARKNISTSTLDHARSMRKQPSPAERLLWSKLRGAQLGLRIRRQHPVGPYIVDFYVPACRLVIEVDGDSHGEPLQVHHDSERTAYLQETGITVVRFTNRDVLNNMQQVLTEIHRRMNDESTPL